MNLPRIKIAPSILSADFGRLNEEIAEIEPYCDWIHVDVMDGHFVPNITIGPPVIRKIKTIRPLDCHLMIENADKYIEAFKEAGAASISVHPEAQSRIGQLIRQIKKLGVKAGAALNPATPLSAIGTILDDLDYVLIMSVNPGFGGQEFMPEVLPKIRELRRKRPEMDIEVDGGINLETAREVVSAGANVLVAGSYIFGVKDRKAAIDSLRNVL